MEAAESEAVDILAALSAAIEALGNVMLEMQWREMLERTGTVSRWLACPLMSTVTTKRDEHRA